MDQEMEKLLWEFIDGHSSDTEKTIIARHLADNPAWRDKYDELMLIHKMLHQEELEMPSLRFTKNVMEQISQPQVSTAAKTYINKQVIRGIFAFFLIMIGGLFIYIIGQTHWNSQPTGNLLPAFSENVNDLKWTKLLTGTYVNIFIGITAMLGLIVMDKYLQTKKNLRRMEP
jgi:hypothetical protein